MKTDFYCWIENTKKTPVPSTEAFERWLDPTTTAIACIDMHRGHVGPENQLTLAAPRARAKLPAHNLDHRLGRENRIPGIHVQHCHRYGRIGDAASTRWTG